MYIPFYIIPILSFNIFSLKSVSFFYHIGLPFNFVLYTYFIQVMTTITKLFANVKHKAFSICIDGLQHCKEMTRQILSNSQSQSKSLCRPQKSFAFNYSQ